MPAEMQLSILRVERDERMIQDLEREVKLFLTELDDKMKALTETRIASPIKAVETLAQRASLNEGEKSSVLKHLIEGGDLSMWGLQNALTRAAQDVTDYDRATDLERFGGKMLNLGKTEYRELAMAA
jgi:phage host-nuclease inhibitor protein Gam